MSAYALQKLIRDINRNPDVRRRFTETPDALVVTYDLTEAERGAVVGRDYAALYGMGVHGLLLRPFSILHQISEADYLAAIRGADR